MRSIPPVMSERVRSMLQTRANNANPRLRAILTRHTVLMQDYDMWQTMAGPGSAPSRTSVAVSHPRAEYPPDAVYVAVVEGGAGKVYMGAPAAGSLMPATFTLMETITGATDIAVAFEGYNYQRGTSLEFVTAGVPWVFWVDGAGAIQGKQLTDGSVAIALGNGSRITAASGASTANGNVTHGLVLAWCTAAGDVYARQYLNGWDIYRQCQGMPAGVVDLSLSRLWDQRTCLMVKTSDGKIRLIPGVTQAGDDGDEHQVGTGDNAVLMDGLGSEIKCSIAGGSAYGFS